MWVFPCFCLFFNVHGQCGHAMRATPSICIKSMDGRRERLVNCVEKVALYQYIGALQRHIMHVNVINVRSLQRSVFLFLR